MKDRLLELLACPACGAAVLLAAAAREPDGEIAAGELACAGCDRRFPIVRGVPRMAGDVEPEQAATAAAFGWQWQRFTELDLRDPEQFLDWVWPLGPEAFRGRLVLDAGCGIGRHVRCAADFGAREVVGVDLSAAVETAYRHVGRRPNVHVVQGDLHRLPLRRARFDLVYSIGVLHHLPEPERGFQAIVPHAAPGGVVFAWVYGHEGNALIHHVVDPLRTAVTSRLPRSALFYLSALPAALLQGLVKGLYGPVSRRPRLGRLKRRLWYGDYLTHLAAFGFRHNHAIVFDHLVAPTAFYVRGDDFRGWFERAGLEGVTLTRRHGNSWRGRGEVPRTGARGPAERAG